MGTPRTIAKTALLIADELGLKISNLTAHKLLYLAHGLMLAKHDRPLVDTPFQAWKYGPVLEDLYHDLKIFGSSPIPHDSVFVARWPELPPENQEDREVIRAILKQFGNKSPGYLIEVSHQEDGPWNAVYEANTPSIEISDAKISAYFKKHLTKN